MPKNHHNLKKIIKESLGDMEWIKKTNVDFIKLGSVFMDNEEERFVIDNISPNGLTIKSLDFPKDKEDTTIRKNWRKEDWLKLIDDGDIRCLWDGDLNESEEFDWIKKTQPNWSTYYETIMRDIEGLPKNLEDTTNEMLLPIWMKIHTINRQILTRDKQDIDGNVDKLFENMGRIEWMFERMMKLVDGEVNTSMVTALSLKPHDYYKSKRLTIISLIKGMLSQLELIGESKDLDWIKDTEPTNLDFNFDGKENWVDVSKIDREGRKKIVNYIKKTVPNYEEFEGDLFGHISRGNYKGIIIHCGSDRTDFEPEENLLCSANSSYERDYEMDNPYADISKSIYIDGQDILDYISVVGEEELDESLEWSDKDAPFDEKDKSFESDPSWKNDEDWTLNPERSYWKQGDAGGSGGGDMNESDELGWIKDVKPDKLSASPDVFFRSDDDMFYTLDQLGHDSTNMTEMTMVELAANYGYRWSEEHEGWYHRDEVADFMNGNFPKGVRRGLDESDELQWIKNVPDTIPSRRNRKKISLKDFLIDVMKDDVDLLHFLISEDTVGPTEEYMRTGNGGEGFTPEDWDDFGYDEWAGDGNWVDNHEWRQDPQVWQNEIREAMEFTDGAWKMVEWESTDYDLERGTHMDRMVFKRKSDGAYFALNFSGSHYDGIDAWDDEIYQVFPKQITKFIYESNKKIMYEGDMSWIEDVEPHKNYEGHPQGIVLLRNHQEIDEFCDTIDNYNSKRIEGVRNGCDELHQGLEDRRSELEEMSAEDGEDYGEAILSGSFFVEKRYPNKLTIGYWPWDVSGDSMYISDWLDGDSTFNKEYQLYNNFNQLKRVFKNYKNPIL